MLFRSTLSLVSGEVIGTTVSNGDVFKISVNSSGVVTLTQYQEIDHLPSDSATSNYDVQEAVLANGKVLLTGTVIITDDDGDTAAANGSLDLGGNIVFDDDGPSVSATATDNAELLLNTQDADTIAAATDTDSQDFSGQFAHIADYGADDVASDNASWSYALSVSNATSGLTHEGESITLSLVSGEVIGTTVSNGDVFKISVNSSGVVTLTQYQEIDHLPSDSATSNYDVQEAVLANGKVLLTGTVIITDDDGDTAAANDSLDLGGNIVFDDDGPSVSATATDNADLLLNTQDADTIAAATDTDSQDFSGQFAHIADYGADDVASDNASWSYALSVSNATSGLTHEGESITLSLVSGEVIGTTVSNGDVFKISVNSSGVVTLTQYQEIDHLPSDSATSNYDVQEAVLANGKVLLTGTVIITDDDGDTAAANDSLDLGGNIVFDDDGPSVSATATDNAELLLNTQDADTIAAATDTDSQDFSGQFAHIADYGADDVASDNASWSYALSVSNATSGLTHEGESITISLVSGEVIGTTVSNGDVFKISVNSSGVVTLTQYQEIDHLPSDSATSNYDVQEAVLSNGKVALTGTVIITDDDGDTATANDSLDLGGNIVFDDDGPSVSATATDNAELLLNTQDADTIAAATDTDSQDFSGQFAHIADYGADDVASDNASWSYALSVSNATSGLTHEGESITLSLVSGEVIGTTVSNGDVFKISVNSSGVVTLTQYQEIDHLPSDSATSNYDVQQAVLANGKVALTGTVIITDDDGDTATANDSLDLGGNIVFDDDGPSVSATATDNAELLLNTQDADTIAAATDTDSQDFSGQFAHIADYGADDVASDNASWSYALSVSNATSGLTHEGESITLSLVSGEVIGTTVSNGDVFKISVNSSGVVTLTQYQEIDHLPSDSATSNYDVQEAVLSNGKVALTGTVIITDDDGDTATANDSLDLGGNIVFDDDGPSVSATATDNAELLLNTQDADTIAAATDTDSQDFSGQFAHIADYGADDVVSDNASWSYALSVSNATSGLTHEGESITLSLVSGEVIGTTVSNGDVFKISVNSSGVVTLTQYQEIDHLPSDSATSNYDVQEAVLANGKVLLTGTVIITDDDGDTATANDSLDLGGNIVFDDDGPSVSATATDNAELLLNTQDADTIAAATDTDSQDFSGQFAHIADYGADDVASDNASWSYALSVSNATSGLTHEGESITLSLVSGEVIGTTVSNGDVFKISVNSSGVVTLTQYQEIDHMPSDSATSNYDVQEAVLANGKVLLTGTVIITDDDGDTATANDSLDLGGNIVFDDDGPSVSATATDNAELLLNTQDADTIAAATDTDSQDFSGQFAHIADYGADDVASDNASWSYALSVSNATSGLTHEGESITLSLVSGEVIGTTVSNGDVFKISVNSSGVVTLTQYQEIDHLPSDSATSNYDVQEAVLSNGKVALTGTVIITDDDGDTATANDSLDLGGNIVFDDDGPSVSATATDNAELLLNTQDADTIAAATDTDSQDFSGQFAHIADYGADDVASDNASWSYALSVSNATSGLTHEGESITLSLVSGEVIGTTVSNGDVFKISVNSSGVVTLTQYQEIDHLPSDSATSNYDVQEAVLANGKVLLTGTVIITDDDGDTATANDSLDLGGNIVFDDDGPSVSATATDNAELLLNTQDADTIAAAIDTDSQDFSGQFAHIADYGADDVASDNASWSYALSVSNATSGLTHEGESITLSLVSGEVIGTTVSNGDVFKISVNSSGVVTLTQYQEIDHLPSDSATSNYDVQQAVLANGKVLLTGTVIITDDDGDTATANDSLDLGGNIVFDDDGPSIISQFGTSSVYVDIPYTTSGTPITYSSIALASLNFGADDAATLGAYEITGLPTDYTATSVSIIGGNLEFSLSYKGDLIADFSINPSSGSNDSMTVYQLPGEIVFAEISGAAAKAGGPGVYYVEAVNADVVAEVTGSYVGSPPGLGSVNASNKGWAGGDGNQNMEDNETILFTFKDYDNSMPNNAGGNDSVESFSFDLQKFTGSGNNPTVSIVVTYVDSTTHSFVATVPNSFSEYSFFISENGLEYGDSLIMNGVQDPGESFEAFFNDSGIFKVEIQDVNDGSQTFVVNNIIISAASDLRPDLNPSFNLEIEDGDGDTSSLEFNLNFDGNDVDGPTSLTISSMAPPVVLDLNNDGFNFIAHDEAANQVLFDFDNDGNLEQGAWIEPGDAFLVYDMNQDGVVNSGEEIIFANPDNGAYTDLDGLRLNFDTNDDGVLDRSDAEFDKFGLWQDENLNGVSEEGEFASLTDLDISSIDLTSTGEHYTAAEGEVNIYGESTFTYEDGTTGNLADVGLAIFEDEGDQVVDNGNYTFELSLGDLLEPGTITTIDDFNADSDNLSFTDVLDHDHNGLDLGDVDEHISSIELDETSGDLVVQFEDVNGNQDAGGQLIFTAYNGNAVQDLNSLADVVVNVDVS